MTPYSSFPLFFREIIPGPWTSRSRKSPVSAIRLVQEIPKRSFFIVQGSFFRNNSGYVNSCSLCLPHPIPGSGLLALHACDDYGNNCSGITRASLFVIPPKSRSASSDCTMQQTGVTDNSSLPEVVASQPATGLPGSPLTHVLVVASFLLLHTTMRFANIYMYS
jgi:hypothetical protein